MGADPITLGLAIAALATSVGGAVYGGVQAKQTAKFNEQIANNEAQYQRQAAALNAQKREEKLKRQMAEGTVAVAKSGGSLLSTTAQEVFDENLEEGLFDVAMIRYGGDRAAEASLAEGRLARSQGNAAFTSSMIQAGGSLLTGAKGVKDAYKPSAPSTGGSSK